MAMTFIATTSDKVETLAIKNGQLIFSRDNRVIYLDANDERTTFQQIITLSTEKQRTGLAEPLQGFYFVKETCMLWQYDDSTWMQLTTPPSESIIFGDKDEFPGVGKEKTLYVDSKAIYQWDSINNEYIEMGTPKWSGFAQ